MRQNEFADTGLLSLGANESRVGVIVEDELPRLG